MPMRSSNRDSDMKPFGAKKWNRRGDRVDELYLVLPGVAPYRLLTEERLTPRQLRFLFAAKYAAQMGVHTVGRGGTPIGKQRSLGGGGLSAVKTSARREMKLSGLAGPKAAGSQEPLLRATIAQTLRQRLLDADQRHELATRAKSGKPRQYTLRTQVKTSSGGAVKSTFFSNDGKHDYQTSGALGMRQYLLAAHKGRRLPEGFENWSPKQIEERFMATMKKHQKRAAA